MQKYYNFETRFISLRDKLKEFLNKNNIYYECSGAYSFYHFEILANQAELLKINNFLNSESITEV